MGRLDVRIVSARNLADTQWVSKPDPYCIVKLENQKHKTTVKDNQLNPEWNEVFKFVVSDPDSSQLVVEVWNKNVVTDELMGSYSLSLSNLMQGEVRDEYYMLQRSKSHAEIRLRLLAHDFGRTMQLGAAQRPSGVASAPAPYQSTGGQGYYAPPAAQPQGVYNTSQPPPAQPFYAPVNPMPLYGPPQPTYGQPPYAQQPYAAPSPGVVPYQQPVYGAPAQYSQPTSYPQNSSPVSGVPLGFGSQQPPASSGYYPPPSGGGGVFGGPPLGYPPAAGGVGYGGYPPAVGPGGYPAGPSGYGAPQQSGNALGYPPPPSW